MPGREVHAREILEDIRDGLDNDALKRKYRLTSDGLQRLFDELVEAGLLEQVGNRYIIPAVRRLSARRIVRDIRAGLRNADLMNRYGLNPKQLRNTFDILLESKAINHGELRNDLSVTPDQLKPINHRELDRYYLDFDLPIVETGPPEVDGRVRDITEKGVGMIGIPSRVDEVKTFLVLHDEFVLIEPFMFEAQCRWSRQEPDGRCAAGYRITNISAKDLKDLRQLIHLVTFYG